MTSWKPLSKFDVHVVFFLWEDGIISDKYESTVVSNEVLVILAINPLGKFVQLWLAKFFIGYYHDTAIDAPVLLFLGLQFTGRMCSGHCGNYPLACLGI